MIRKLAGIALYAALAAGCGTSTTDPTTGITTDRYAGTLVDPNSCNCGNGINQYAVAVGKDGVVEATATWTQADAVVVLRLTDNSFNTVFAVSTANGTTARLAHNAPAGQHQMQTFLSPGPGGTATFNLEIKHP